MKQKIYNYTAILDPAEEGGFNVSFPAFPGCVTFGKTFEEAKEKAKEVLELWIVELIAMRKRLPVRKSRPIVDDVEVEVPVR